jgi:hypothetical protein
MLSGTAGRDKLRLETKPSSLRSPTARIGDSTSLIRTRAFSHSPEEQDMLHDYGQNSNNVSCPTFVITE